MRTGGPRPAACALWDGRQSWHRVGSSLLAPVRNWTIGAVVESIDPGFEAASCFASSCCWPSVWLRLYDLLINWAIFS
jgi:hypothetical protein